jgi:thymidylate kinase
MWRVAIVGIDGSGKTTTALRLVERLAGTLDVCKPGRPPVVTRGGRTETFMPEAARAMEAHLRRADGTGKRLRVALSRRRYLRFITRMERQMAARFGPDLMLLARCPTVDPAVYAEFYLPRLARALSLPTRLRLAAWLARVPPRQLYFLLDTPVPVAMERIRRRLEELNAVAGAGDGREHWLHLHERPEVLERLAGTMRRALQLVQRRTGARVVRIDSGTMRQDGVVELMAERVLCLDGRPRRLSPTAAVARPPAADGFVALPLAAPVSAPPVLLPAGPGRLLALAANDDGLSCCVVEVVDGIPGEPGDPFPVDPGRVGQVRAMPPLTPREPPDAWALYTASTAAGVEIRLARFRGRADPLMSTSSLVHGNAPSGAWGRSAAGEVQALVAYVEPSRTALWGMLVRADASVAVPPFLLAPAEPDELLADAMGRGFTAVAFDAGSGRWEVWYLGHGGGGAGDGPRRRRVQVDGDATVTAPVNEEAWPDAAWSDAAARPVVGLDDGVEVVLGRAEGGGWHVSLRSRVE